jgi:hypothetical protein
MAPVPVPAIAKHPTLTGPGYPDTCDPASPHFRKNKWVGRGGSHYNHEGSSRPPPHIFYFYCQRFLWKSDDNHCTFPARNRRGPVSGIPAMLTTSTRITTIAQLTPGPQLGRVGPAFLYRSGRSPFRYRSHSQKPPSAKSPSPKMLASARPGSTISCRLAEVHFR